MSARLLAVPAVLACLLLVGCASSPDQTLSSAGNDDPGYTTNDTVPVAPVTHDLVYTISSPQGGVAHVDYEAITGSSGGGIEAADVHLPWTKDVTLDGSPVAVFSLLGQSKGAQSTISCTITLDGTVISQKTSSGRFSVVTCSGSNQ